MGADLHIHVFEGIELEHLRVFNRNTVGSKYFQAFSLADSGMSWEAAYDAIAETPSVWIGEVSWLKAAFFGDAETFVPSAVQIIANVIGEDLPVIDAELTAKILAAFEQPNTTSYGLADKAEVAAFLAQHSGKRVFTVSW